MSTERERQTYFIRSGETVYEDPKETKSPKGSPSKESVKKEDSKNVNE